MSTINIFGHKSPDLDSIASATAYAYLKNKIDSENEYIASRLGEINAETKYAFEKFKLELPEMLDSAVDKKFILVDHNSEEESIEQREEGEIVEVIDHHKVKFEYKDPIYFRVEPIGSACSILAKMFKESGVEIPKNIAGIMLSAALIDTVITKSPTCTEQDVEIIKELSEIVGVDYKDFGMELFKVRAQVSSLTPRKIYNNDHKDYDINGKKVGISQIETVDPSEFDNLKETIFEVMKDEKEKGNFHTIIVFITDILKEGSQFLVLSDEPEKFERGFGCKLENNQCYLENIMSRKKQVVPPLMDNF